MTDISSELEALGGMAYEVDGGYVAEVPDPHVPHSYISVHAYRVVDDWYLTDGRITQQTCDESFEALRVHAACAGLRLQIDDDGTLSTKVKAGTLLHEAIHRFAADVGAAPMIARALRCASDASKPREESLADQMARTARSHLAHRFPVLDARGAIRLKPKAPKGSATVHVRPRLAIYRTGGPAAPPEVVCEFMDLGAARATRAFSPVASTFLAYHYVPHLFVIAKGTSAQMDELAELVEPVQASVVAESDYGPLDEVVARLV